MSKMRARKVDEKRHDRWTTHHLAQTLEVGASGLSAFFFPVYAEATFCSTTGYPQRPDWFLSIFYCFYAAFFSFVFSLSQLPAGSLLLPLFPWLLSNMSGRFVFLLPGYLPQHYSPGLWHTRILDRYRSGLTASGPAWPHRIHCRFLKMDTSGQSWPDSFLSSRVSM